jgi:electron transport complex protein RnfB
MISGILALAVLAAFFGLILGLAAVLFKVEASPVVEKVDAILPQTQCGQCGYPGCRPYAEAIANEEAPINLCPPGGEATVQALADLLDLEVIPLQEADEDSPGSESPGPIVAVIDEAVCIGCTLCIQACPVDAILGAAKQMHTVIEAECTGCELCIEPCPVDCIDMVPVKETVKNWKWSLPQYHINNKDTGSIYTTISKVLTENAAP